MNNDIENLCTPEKIAQYLLNGNIDESINNMIEMFPEENSAEGNPYTFTFEILITIFMELLFGIAKLHNKQELNYDTLNLDEIFSFVSEKILALNSCIPYNI